MVSRPNIATYNVRTQLKDIYVPEAKRRETTLLWDMIRIGEVRKREEGCTNLERGQTTAKHE